MKSKLWLILFIVSVCMMSCSFNAPLLMGEIPSYQGGISNKREWSILIMMNGTNLESDMAMATANLAAIFNARHDQERINVIVLTCGTRTWHSNSLLGYEIPQEPCTWLVTEGRLELIRRYGLVPISDSSLLPDVITTTHELFPSHYSALILWDHGGGPVGGFGQDQLFGGQNISLTRLVELLELSGSRETPFDIIGFDTCNMASLEIATMLAPFGTYLLSSQEIEPLQGWGYEWLGTFSGTVDLSPLLLGKTIVDAFISSNLKQTIGGLNPRATLSMLDMSHADEIFQSLEALVNGFGSMDDDLSFILSARIRSKVIEYSERWIPSDLNLIDLYDLAMVCQTECPQLYGESIALQNVIADAVVYHDYNSVMGEAYGVSVLWPYTCYNSDRDQYLTTLIERYKKLDVGESYTQFLVDFVDRILGQPIRDVDFTVSGQSVNLSVDSIDFIRKLTYELYYCVDEVSNFYWQLGELNAEVDTSDGRLIGPDRPAEWWTVDGRLASMFQDPDQENRMYIPAFLFADDVPQQNSLVYLIVQKDLHYPNGIILGAFPVKYDPMAIPVKAFFNLSQHDLLYMVYFCYEGMDQSVIGKGLRPPITNFLVTSDGWELSGRPHLSTISIPADTPVVYRYCATDYQGNRHYSDTMDFVPYQP